MARLASVTCGILVLLTCSGSTIPQSSADAQARSHSVRLVLLGTAGGPILRRDRSQPSNLLVVDGTPYLIDAGIGSTQQLIAAGVAPQDVKATFITHHHLDHDGGLADLIEEAWLGRPAERISVIGPLGTKRMVAAALELVAPAHRILQAEGLMAGPEPATIFDGRDISGPGLIYEDAQIRVIAAENSHFRYIPSSSPSFGRDRSYSFRIETPHGAYVFTGDTGPSANVEALAKGADVLVTEVIDAPAAVRFAMTSLRLDEAARPKVTDHMRAEHMTPDQIGRLAQLAGVKMVVLTHFSPGEDGERSIEPYVSGIRASYKGPVMAGRDLDEIVVP